MTSVSADRRFGVNSGAALKVPVRTATTANVTLSGEQTVDGVSLVTDDRVLVKNQTSGADNGIYLVDTGTWTRSPDWDGSYDVVTGTAVYVTAGTTNSGTYWAVSTTGAITIGTTSVAFTNAVISSAASISTIQSGSGAVSEQVQDEIRRLSITPQQYGAVGDNSTDDSAAIARAFTYAATLVAGGAGLSRTYKPTVWFPPSAGYKTTSTISVPQNINVIMDGPIIYTGSTNEIALDIGVDSGSDVTRGGRYVIDVRRNTQSDWSSTSCIGVRFRGVSSSDIWIRRADQFTIGVQFEATANFGCFFNKVQIGELRGNKYGGNLDSSNVAFANNNNQFYGGEHAVESNASTNGKSRYGWYLSGSNQHNANEWFGPSMELAVANASPGVAVPFLIEKGTNNVAYSVRMEGGSSDIAVITDTAAINNRFEPALDSRSGALRATTISDSSYSQTSVFNTPIRLLKQGANLVFDSGNLGWATNLYDGSTTYTVDGFDICASDFSMFIAQNSMAGHDRYLSFSASGRNLVRWIDTSVNKRFIVEFETESGSATFGYLIKPYDATQTILADNPTPAHVFGEDSAQLTWNGALQTDGAYTVSASAAYTYAYFACDSLTKIIAFVVLGSSGLKLKRVRIYALDYECSTWQVLRARGMNGKYIASTIPAVGSWVKGTRIWRHDATSGATDGWAVTTAGTLDTALSGVTATTTLNSTQVTVNDASNLETGKYITIVGVTGTKRIVGVNGTTVVIDVKADAAVSGAAVAYTVAVLKLMANLS